MNTVKQILLLVIPFVFMSAPAVSDQTKSSGFEPQRNAQGHPNIQGIWDFRTLTPLERPLELGDKAVFSEEEENAFRNKVVQINDTDNKKDLDLPAEFDVEVPYNNFWLDYGTAMNEDRRTSLIVDPPNGRLPERTPEALAGMKNYLLRDFPVRDFFSIGLATFRPAGPESLGLSERCMVGFNAGPPLIPSAYNNNLRIVQAPNHVVIFTEMVHDARIVPIDGSPHLPSEIEKWTGDSRGHWEGDTLVVETTNFTDKTPAYQLPLVAGQIAVVGSGKNLHLTERFTRTSDSQLIYEYTVNAPGSFTKPFTVAIPMRATEDQIFEYACHEGNHAMIGMLRGARQMEKEAAMASAE
ncbi:MAG: hypothetical protein JKX97_00340 [Candidatus Lindowbacteria bacterium]|nr:hypothetical protein [Candidatus Lindowbacteria bacterium]